MGGKGEEGDADTPVVLYLQRECIWLCESVVLRERALDCGSFSVQDEH